MRWEHQDVGAVDAAALPGLERLGAVATRTFDTPEFAGLVFHEVLAKSALNQVPDTSRKFAGSWTINPYRGCSHACTYCFARTTHEYLDLDGGHDFDSQIVVKTNIVEVLRQELRTKARDVPMVMLGSNTDPYQRAEGRYALMPGIYRALTEARIPFSVLTKGTLLRRDLPLLAELAERIPVSVAMSIPIVDETLREQFEPGTPTTRARLATIRRAADLGLEPDVFMMPILPHLTDSEAALRRALERIAEAGARRVLFQALYLKPGVRGWFLRWLGEYHPQLVVPYARLYAHGQYADPGYRDAVAARIRPLLREYGLDGRREAPQVDECTGLIAPVRRRMRSPRRTSSSDPAPAQAQAPTLF